MYRTNLYRFFEAANYRLFLTIRLLTAQHPPTIFTFYADKSPCPSVNLWYWWRRNLYYVIRKRDPVSTKWPKIPNFWGALVFSEWGSDATFSIWKFLSFFVHLQIAFPSRISGLFQKLVQQPTIRLACANSFSAPEKYTTTLKKPEAIRVLILTSLFRELNRYKISSLRYVFKLLPYFFVNFFRNNWLTIKCFDCVYDLNRERGINHSPKIFCE